MDSILVRAGRLNCVYRPGTNWSIHYQWDSHGKDIKWSEGDIRGRCLRRSCGVERYGRCSVFMTVLINGQKTATGWMLDGGIFKPILWNGGRRRRTALYSDTLQRGANCIYRHSKSMADRVAGDRP